MTIDKKIKSINMVFFILVLLCVLVMFFPMNYSIEYSVSEEKKDFYSISKIDYISDADYVRYKADGSNSKIEIPCADISKFEKINIYADTLDVEMRLKSYGILVKNLGTSPIKNNSLVEYNMMNDNLRDYSVEEMLDLYCNDNYLVIMVVCGDYSVGVTDSIQEKFNDLNIEITPRDAGKILVFMQL